MEEANRRNQEEIQKQSERLRKQDEENARLNVSNSVNNEPSGQVNISDMATLIFRFIFYLTGRTFIKFPVFWIAGIQFFSIGTAISTIRERKKKRKADREKGRKNEKAYQKKTREMEEANRRNQEEIQEYKP